MEKYIIIPESRPLYAMQKCFGPTQGPLTVPTRTPVDIIRLLLLQSGNEKLTIFEVPYKSANPVQLTLENYNKPYDEIISAKPSEMIETTNMIPEDDVIPEPVMPVMVESEPVIDEVKVEEPVADKYAGMTKAERKAARRAEREAEALAMASAQASEETVVEAPSESTEIQDEA